jgi:hypothetical protein
VAVTQAAPRDGTTNSINVSGMTKNHVRVEGRWTSTTDYTTTVALLDTIAPTVASVTRTDPSPTAANTVSYTVDGVDYRIDVGLWTGVRFRSDVEGPSKDPHISWPGLPGFIMRLVWSSRSGRSRSALARNLAQPPNISDNQGFAWRAI